MTSHRDCQHRLDAPNKLDAALLSVPPETFLNLPTHSSTCISFHRPQSKTQSILNLRTHKPIVLLLGIVSHRLSLKMRISLTRAAAPLRTSYLRPQINLIHLPCVQQRLQSSPSQFPHPSRSFSTHPQLHTQNPSPNSPNSPKQPLPPNPSFDAASFKELGATRTVKIVVYIAVAVMGTAETFTWSKFLWAKFGPKEEDAEIEAEK